MSDEVSAKVMEYFPQVWGFFSKDPRDDYFYVIDMESEELGAHWPNMALKNWAGLKRFGRSQRIEMGRIFAQVGDKAMAECEQTPVECLKNQEDVIHVTNDPPSPTIKGYRNCSPGKFPLGMVKESRQRRYAF